jgi:hypothetical protein
MKRFRILGIALLALCALGTVMSVAASAEEGFLPTPSKEKNKGSIKGGKSTIGNAKATFICTSLDASPAEFEKDKHGTATLKWKGCTSAGIALNSLGDEKGVILAKVLLLLCLINLAKLEFGVAIEPDETIHLEASAAGILGELKGLFIGRLSSAKGKEFRVTLKASKLGEQEVKECLDAAGTKKGSLEESLNHEAFAPESEEVLEGVISFEKEVELMDT